MKACLIFCLSAFSIILANCYEIQITSILTDKVASNGMLILDTTGLNIAIKDYKPLFGKFSMIIKNERTKDETSLKCTLYQFTYISRESAKICCLTKGLETGRYSVNPIKKKMQYISYPLNIYINPSNIEGTFLIESGEEIYFYDGPGNTYVNLYRDYDCDKIEFSLFEHISDIKDTIIYFNDIPIKCYFSGIKVICPIKAEQFTQTKYNSYNLSLPNRKKNYFLHSVSITLYYIN